MSDAGAGLPFHCPVLRASFFKSPCAGQMAAAKNRRQTYPGAVMPYGLEQCLQCGGKWLVTRERPAAMVATVKENLTVQEEEPMNYPVRMVTESSATEAPPCSKHPGNPQIACSPDGKRAGQYLGACKVCMQERKTGRKPKEQMMPAVARDLGIIKQPNKDRAMPAIKFKNEAEAERVLGPGKLPADPAAEIPPSPPLLKGGETPRACHKHPDRPARIDRLGRSMGLCEECVAARGQKWVADNKRLGRNYAPVGIPLNAPQYAELRAWLVEEAAELEQDLAQQIMYRLKLAMRAAG